MWQKVMAQPIKVLKPLMAWQPDAFTRKMLDSVASNVATSAAKENPSMQVQSMRAMQRNAPAKSEARRGSNRPGL